MDASKTVVYVGKTVKYDGKRLFDILCRLKNFGVGRIVYQQSDKDKYPEACYTIITKVQPDMSNPTQANLKTPVKSLMWGKKIFRGHDVGEHVFTTCYKANWKLVLKEDEESFLAEMAKKEVHKKEEAPKQVRFPPLLERMLFKAPLKTPPMLPLITANQNCNFHKA